MRNCIIIVFSLLIVSFQDSFGFSVDQAQKVFNAVDEEIDFHGAKVELPLNSVLIIGKKGKLVNGILIGNNTKIIGCHRDAIGVTLLGSWKTKHIFDTWFDKGFLTDNQIIDNINALQSDNIKQIIEINRDYSYALNNNRIFALNISSNTILNLNSVISIQGNNLTRYDVARIVRKENIQIRGGVLQGDVGKHEYIKGTTSEWGFALYIFDSKNIVLDGLTVELCTGDGIYVTGSEEDHIGEYKHASNNILIKKCIFSELRRDGIGLIHAYNVKIKDCRAMNMGRTEYTPPCYGINIEPNKGLSVKDVRIEDFVTTGTCADFSFSTGGYQFDGLRSNRKNIILNRCLFDKGVAIMSGGVKVKNSSMRKVAIYTSNVPKGKDGDVVFNNCIIEGGYGIQFDGRKKMNDTSPFPRYYFNNCTITASGVYNPVPGLIWGTDLKNVMANLRFKNCDISLKPGLKGNTLMAKGLDIDCVFKKCKINLNGYVFTPMNNVFDRCTIECYSINESNDASFVKRTKIKIGQQ